MNGLTDTVKNNILNYIFNKDSGEFRSPDYIKVALVALNPRTHTYEEVSTNNTGYERQLVEFTQSTDCTLSSSNEIKFNKSTKGWGEVSKLRLYAYYETTKEEITTTTEEMIYEIDLLESRVIESGCDVKFNANSLKINLK